MSYRGLVARLLFGAVVSVGCQHTDPIEPEPTVDNEAAVVEAPSRRPEAHGTSREPRTVVSQGIPTEEDYEVEAAARIRAENVEAELAKLEAEISPN